MKHSNLLTLAASISFSAFVILLAFGLVSMPVFLGSAMIWISLITIHSYTPQHRTWLPRTAKARLMAQAKSQKASLALAA